MGKAKSDKKKLKGKQNKKKKGGSKKEPAKPKKAVATKAKMPRREAKERSFSLFSQGYNPTDVSRELGISRTTATSYKKQYEQKIADEVKANPGFLRDAVANTMRALKETDEVRKTLWNRLKSKGITHDVKCAYCGEFTEFECMLPPTDATVIQASNSLLKANETRAKLFGLLGVKQEVLVEIHSVNIVQNRIMAFLAENLQGEQREELASFIEVELKDFIKHDGDEIVPVIDAGLIGELASGAAAAPLELTE